MLAIVLYSSVKCDGIQRRMVSWMTEIKAIQDSGVYKFLIKCATIAFNECFWVYYLGYVEDGEHGANHLTQPLNQLEKLS